MGRQIDQGKWKGRIEHTKIFVNNFVLAPSEVSKLTGLIGISGSMAELKALPEEISDPPFSIQFNENGEHTVSREGDYETIAFSFEDTDDLIQALNTFLNASMDMQRIAPLPIKTGGVGPNTPDVFDGRN